MCLVQSETNLDKGWFLSASRLWHYGVRCHGGMLYHGSMFFQWWKIPGGKDLVQIHSFPGDQYGTANEVCPDCLKITNLSS